MRDSRYARDLGTRWYEVSGVPRNLLNQGLQPGKCSNMHVRMRLDSDGSACSAVKHPHRKLRASTRRVAVATTPADIGRRSLDHLVNVNNAPSPRVKKIKYLARLGPVGVASLCCTMADVLTPRLTGAHPIKLTTPRCPTAPHTGRSPLNDAESLFEKPEPPHCAGGGEQSPSLPRPPAPGIDVP